MFFLLLSVMLVGAFVVGCASSYVPPVREPVEAPQAPAVPLVRDRAVGDEIQIDWQGERLLTWRVSEGMDRLGTCSPDDSDAYVPYWMQIEVETNPQANLTKLELVNFTQGWEAVLKDGRTIDVPMSYCSGISDPPNNFRPGRNYSFTMVLAVYGDPAYLLHYDGGSPTGDRWAVK